MSLKQWADNGWLRADQTSPKLEREHIEFTLPKDKPPGTTNKRE